MEKIAVYCLHGFLGLPRDWDFLEPTAFDLKKVDALSGAGRFQTILDWATAFNQEVKQDGKRPRAILGYSMGGRLALHSLALDPSLWDAAIIVSASPWEVPSPQARLTQDEEWAQRFKNDDWEKVVSAWNELPVFKGSQPMAPRRENDFKRQELAHVLKAWSPALVSRCLSPLSDHISRLQIPISWVAGQNDARYVEIAREMIKNTTSPRFETQIIPHAGHRAPWDQPAAFQEYFCSFLERSLLKVRT